MTNQIISDSFETLGGVVKSTAGQVKQVVKQMGDDVAESVGLKPADSAGTSEQSEQQQMQKSDDQIKKMDAKQKSLARKRYKEIQEEIRQLQSKRAQEMTKYNQPGFTDEEKQKNKIGQLEEKPASAPAGAKAMVGKKATAGGKELPPLPVQRASKKTEVLRGVSG